MDNQNILALILAAGQGKRMKSNLPKVAHALGGKALIIWVMESLISAGIHKIVPVISPTQSLIRKIIQEKNFHSEVNIQFASQDKQLGTAHAVSCGIKSINKFYQDKIPSNLQIVVAYGDTPSVKAGTFVKLISTHSAQKNSFTILAFKTSTPQGYGRIILNEKEEFIAIREEKDCSPLQESIQICNSGILCANYMDLISILPLVKNNNAAKEYYLTDIPQYARERGLKVGLMIEEGESQFLGVNTQEQLKKMEEKFNKKL